MKQPRLYWSDPGLALHLAGDIEPTGAHLENLIAGDLRVAGESEQLRVADARHLATFMRDYGDAVPAGVIIHGGRDTYWLTERVLAVPWNRAI